MALVKLAGLAAIAGGALRIADSFLPAYVSAQALQRAYSVTDLFLLLGAFGIYASLARTLGWPGAVGLLAFVFGIVIVRLPAVSLFGFSGYQSGATVALIGISVLGAQMLVRRVAVIAPFLWFGALVIGALGAAFFSNAAQALAGILFGAAFIEAGVDLWRGSNEKAAA